MFSSLRPPPPPLPPPPHRLPLPYPRPHSPTCAPLPLLSRLPLPRPFSPLRAPRCPNSRRHEQPTQSKRRKGEGRGSKRWELGGKRPKSE
ncbi:unnamed protein product [Closterium sp. NIES-53]